MLEQRQLRVLAAVAEAGSMTRAADRLAYTASAVSQQMSALERQVGAPVFVRHARGVHLTEVGQVLLRHAEAVDDQLRRAERDVRDLLELRGGRLRLGAFASAASSLIPEAITEFRSRNVATTLSLDIVDPADAVQAVTNQKLDLAVVFDYPPSPILDTGELDRQDLLHDPVLVALPKDHPKAGDDILSVVDLATESWIRDSSPDPMCRQMLDRSCREGGFEPSVAFEADNYLTIGRLVAAGAAVALVPSLAADQLPGEVALRPLAPPMTRRVSVVHRQGSAPNVDEMIKVLHEVGSSPPRGS